MNEETLGDAGASCLGYFGGLWGPGGGSILAHGFTGEAGRSGRAGTGEVMRYTKSGLVVSNHRYLHAHQRTVCLELSGCQQ